MVFFLDSFFGASKISLAGIDEIKNNAPNIIVWAAPVMFFFVLLEWAIARHQNRDLYDKKETIGSISVGVGNVLINLAMKLTLLYLVIGL